MLLQKAQIVQEQPQVLLSQGCVHQQREEAPGAIVRKEEPPQAHGQAASSHVAQEIIQEGRPGQGRLRGRRGRNLGDGQARVAQGLLPQGQE